MDFLIKFLLPFEVGLFILFFLMLIAIIWKTKGNTPIPEPALRLNNRQKAVGYIFVYGLIGLFVLVLLIFSTSMFSSLFQKLVIDFLIDICYYYIVNNKRSYHEKQIDYVGCYSISAYFRMQTQFLKRGLASRNWGGSISIFTS